ncbi:hypothetical protein BDR22DRAFT_891190 [Usnea florida]
MSLPVMESSSAQIPSTSSSSIHPSFSQPSSTYLPSSPPSSTQTPSTPPSSVLSPTSVTGSTHMSATNLSSPFIASTLPNTVLSTQTSVYQSRNSAQTSPGPQTSDIPQTSSGSASMSSSSMAGSLGASKATISATGSMVAGSSSIQTGTPSSLAPSGSNMLPGVSSTNVINPTVPASSGILATTKVSSKTSPLQTTAVPHWDTITIVVGLPGHQTLSYSPAVEEFEELILSLEDLIRKHRHLPKRDLPSIPSETSAPLSQSPLLDAAAHSHHHGHQHDHLHDQLHRRAAALTSGATVAASSTGIQAAASSAKSAPHADGQEQYSFVDAMTAVPGSLLPEQSAMSQGTPASVAGADKDSYQVSQQHDSAAERVSGWSVAVLGSCLLWLLFVYSLC